MYIPRVLPIVGFFVTIAEEEWSEPQFDNGKMGPGGEIRLWLQLAPVQYIYLVIWRN